MEMQYCLIGNLLYIEDIVKVEKGDTFRMNVADTKPYNADFDGDEMNGHMPQNILAETELRHLAAIPYHIVSPSSTSPIIGIFQDSLLGCFRFSRANINFSKRDAMNLLMSCNRINMDEFSKILSQNSVSSLNYCRKFYHLLR